MRCRGCSQVFTWWLLCSGGGHAFVMLPRKTQRTSRLDSPSSGSSGSLSNNDPDFFSQKDPDVVAKLNRLVFDPAETATYGLEGKQGSADADLVTNCPLWRVSWAARCPVIYPLRRWPA